MTPTNHDHVLARAIGESAYSLSEVIEMLGVKYQTYQRWLRGTQKPNEKHNNKLYAMNLPYWKKDYNLWCMWAIVSLVECQQAYLANWKKEKAEKATRVRTCPCANALSKGYMTIMEMIEDLWCSHYGGRAFCNCPSWATKSECWKKYDEMTSAKAPVVHVEDMKPPFEGNPEDCAFEMRVKGIDHEDRDLTQVVNCVIKPYEFTLPEKPFDDEMWGVLVDYFPAGSRSGANFMGKYGSKYFLQKQLINYETIARVAKKAQEDLKECEAKITKLAKKIKEEGENQDD